MNKVSVPSAALELPNLDALRALAVLLVLVEHLLETIGETTHRTFHPVDWHLGRLGVLLFFVHTCYVLMASLERLGGKGWELARVFFIRRAFRIYPLAVFCVLFVLLVGVPKLPWETFVVPSLPDIASNLLLTTNLTNSERVLSPLWTLPVELQMYVALPVIFLLTNRASDIRWIAALWFVAVLAAVFVAPLSSRLNVAAFAPCFMAGVVAYGLRDRIAPVAPASTWPILLIVVVGAYVGLGLITPGVHHTAVQIGACLAVGVAIPMFRQSTSTVFNRVTHLIAKYSYGIYLFHVVALWAGYFWIAPESQVLRALLTLVVLGVMSVACYHLIESPMIRLGSRLSGRRQAASTGLRPSGAESPG